MIILTSALFSLQNHLKGLCNFAECKYEHISYEDFERSLKAALLKSIQERISSSLSKRKYESSDVITKESKKALISDYKEAHRRKTEVNCLSSETLWKRIDCLIQENFQLYDKVYIYLYF